MKNLLFVLTLLLFLKTNKNILILRIITWDDIPKIQIFTRTGKLVFESKGYLKPWDGTKSGIALPLDTYYYIIEPESGRKPITGFITIIK